MICVSSFGTFGFLALRLNMPRRDDRERSRARHRRGRSESPPRKARRRKDRDEDQRQAESQDWLNPLMRQGPNGAASVMPTAHNHSMTYMHHAPAPFPPTPCLAPYSPVSGRSLSSCSSRSTCASAYTNIDYIREFRCVQFFSCAKNSAPAFRSHGNRATTLAHTSSGSGEGLLDRNQLYSFTLPVSVANTPHTRECGMADLDMRDVRLVQSHGGLSNWLPISAAQPPYPREGHCQLPRTQLGGLQSAHQDS